MASYPQKDCCLKGVKHVGTAIGETKKIGDINTYFVYPESKDTSKALLFLTDVFGLFKNAFLMADQLAANGYFVVMPDLFKGEQLPLSIPKDFDWETFRAKHDTESTDAIIETTIKEMRGKYGTKKIGTLGYCWGGKYVARFLKDGWTDAGFMAHPSNVLESELRAITGPLSIAASEVDHVFPAEKRHQTEAILQEIKVPYQINLYSGVSHGFGVRGDLRVKAIKYAKEQAFLQALFWFNEHLNE